MFLGLLFFTRRSKLFATPAKSWGRYLPGTADHDRAGCDLAGGFAGALVSVQGDLEYFASALNLPRWNVLAGGCPVCKCKRDGECSWMFFQNWEHTAAMEWKPHEWLSWEGKSSCALFQIPSVTGCCVMLDWMHCKYLGSDMWCYGAIFWLLCHTMLVADPLANLLQVWTEMKSFYKQLGVRHRYHYFNRLSMFQRKAGPPKLRGRAAEVQHLNKVMVCLWKKHYNPQLEVHRQVMAWCKLNAAVENILDENKKEVAFEAAVAKEFLDSTCKMCHLHHLLMEHFQHEEPQLFNLTLKTHHLLHLAGHSHQINPRLTWNYSGEDNMGILKKLGQSCVKGLQPVDVVNKMMVHWRYGMHFQMLDA